MDTFYDKMDRGAVPRLPGYQGYVNTLAGQTPGMSRYVPAGGIAGRGAYGAARAGLSPREHLQKRTADLLKQANQANLSRYDEGRELLGLDDGLEWQRQGFAAPSAYDEHREFKARQAAEAAGGAGGGMSFGNPAGGTVGAEGGNITPQALASRVQAKQRGIYNSSTALNQEAVTNSLALRDAAVADRGLAMQSAQFAEQVRRADQSAAERLRDQQLQWIYQRNDRAPDLNRVAQIADTDGEGTTEGLSYPIASGGGGRRAAPDTRDVAEESAANDSQEGSYGSPQSRREGSSATMAAGGLVGAIAGTRDGRRMLSYVASRKKKEEAELAARMVRLSPAYQRAMELRAAQLRT